jgi:hypothetical protein
VLPQQSSPSQSGAQVVPLSSLPAPVGAPKPPTPADPGNPTWSNGVLEPPQELPRNFDRT